MIWAPEKGMIVRKKKRSKSTNISKNGGDEYTNSPDIDTQSYIVESHITDKKKYSITLNMLEKLWAQSIDMNKQILLRLGIKRNKKELFLLSCKLFLLKD